MYKCNTCGATFETLKKIHSGGGDVGEDWGVCPECYDDDYDEARKCDLCCEIVSDVHMCSHVDVCVVCMTRLVVKAQGLLISGLSDTEYNTFLDYYELNEKIR